ncbi:UNVERIFIED_CONTAM: hypothetical protein FKN15_026794 [Acipenser sinensis]
MESDRETAFSSSSILQKLHSAWEGGDGKRQRDCVQLIIDSGEAAFSLGGGRWKATERLRSAHHRFWRSCIQPGRGEMESDRETLRSAHHRFCRSCIQPGRGEMESDRETLRSAHHRLQKLHSAWEGGDGKRQRDSAFSSSSILQKLHWSSFPRLISLSGVSARAPHQEREAQVDSVLSGSEDTDRKVKLCDPASEQKDSWPEEESLFCPWDKKEVDRGGDHLEAAFSLGGWRWKATERSAFSSSSILQKLHSAWEGGDGKRQRDSAFSSSSILEKLHSAWEGGGDGRQRDSAFGSSSILEKLHSAWGGGEGKRERDCVQLIIDSGEAAFSLGGGRWKATERLCIQLIIDSGEAAFSLGGGDGKRQRDSAFSSSSILEKLHSAWEGGDGKRQRDSAFSSSSILEKLHSAWEGEMESDRETLRSAHHRFCRSCIQPGRGRWKATERLCVQLIIDSAEAAFSLGGGDGKRQRDSAFSSSSILQKLHSAWEGEMESDRETLRSAHHRFCRSCIQPGRGRWKATERLCVQLIIDSAEAAFSLGGGDGKRQRDSAFSSSSILQKLHWSSFPRLISLSGVSARAPHQEREAQVDSVLSGSEDTDRKVKLCDPASEQKDSWPEEESLFCPWDKKEVDRGGDHLGKGRGLKTQGRGMDGRPTKLPL